MNFFKTEEKKDKSFTYKTILNYIHLNNLNFKLKTNSVYRRGLYTALYSNCFNLTMLCITSLT